jgi:hypothetical protein
MQSRMSSLQKPVAILGCPAWKHKDPLPQPSAGPDWDAHRVAAAHHIMARNQTLKNEPPCLCIRIFWFICCYSIAAVDSGYAGNSGYCTAGVSYPHRTNCWSRGLFTPSLPIFHVVSATVHSIKYRFCTYTHVCKLSCCASICLPGSKSWRGCLQESRQSDIAVGK